MRNPTPSLRFTASPVRFSTLVEGLATRSGADDPLLDSATFDVDEVRPGTLFVARRDWYGDTHAQVPDALAAGASAVLVSRASALPADAPAAFAEREDPTLGFVCARLYGHPTRSLRVYGVTGTKGKTTTTWMLEHMLRALGEVPALMGTLCYRLGEASVGAPNTTPDALVVQSFAADALARGATALVLEVSSHALALGRVAGVAFDAVGFTNLGRDHLDFHESDAAYFEAKTRLFGAYLEESRAAGKSPSAAICLDTPAGRLLVPQVAPGVPVVTVALDGLSSPERFVVREVGVPNLGGMCAALSVGVAAHFVDLKVFGDHHLLDAGLAAAMLDRTHPGRVADAWASLAHFAGVPGRLERVAPDVFVDYAHTPDSVAHVLSAVRARSDRPLTIVLGCGGDRDRGKRPEMARAAADGADRLVLTSDNPRSEDPERILDDMVAGLPPVAAYERIVDREAAIARAVAGGDAGVLVIAGKGHERTQVVAGRTWHFDDREEARRLCAANAARMPQDTAPLAWGAPDASPARLLADARRRAPGLWVVEASPECFDATLAAVAQVVGPVHCLGGPLGEVAACLTCAHRAVVLTGPVAPIGETADTGPVVPDARVDTAPFDAAAAYAAFDPGRAVHRGHPRMPRLP